MPSEHITFSTVAQRFGWNVRIARQRKGLTQRELARQIDRSQRRIAEWESGRRCPRIDSVVRLAEALEVHPGDLLREMEGLAG